MSATVVAPSEIERQRAENDVMYQEWCRVHGEEALKEVDELRFANPWAHANRIAGDIKERGKVQPETWAYVDTQNTTGMSESLGAWDMTIVMRSNGSDIIDQMGRESARARARGVMAALAIESEHGDGEFSFLTIRAKDAFANHMRDRTMETGTVRRRISPCEDRNTIAAREVGMFPDRSTAVIEDVWRMNDGTFVVRVMSIDRATVPLIRELLAEQGVEIPASAKAEDVLLYEVDLHAATMEEFQAHGNKAIDSFDTLLLKHHPNIAPSGVRPRQGVLPSDNRNMHTCREDLETTEGLLARRQLNRYDEAMSRIVGDPADLPKLIKVIAQRALHSRKTDGKPLLVDAQQALVRSLLATEKVSVSNRVHERAVEILRQVHSSAVQESWRNYVNGDTKALDWMRYEKDDIGFVQSVEMINSGTTAIEMGRQSEYCGEGSAFTSMAVNRMAAAVALAKKEGIPVEEALRRIYKDGTCVVCEEKTKVTCGYCDTCAMTNSQLGSLGDQMNKIKATERKKEAKPMATRLSMFVLAA